MQSFWLRVTGLFLVLFICGSAAADDQFNSSWGKSVSVTNVPAYYTNLNLRSVSVVNNGTNMLYAGINISTNEFTNTIYGTASALPIGASQSFTFDYAGRGLIHSVVFCSTNTAHTNQVVVGGY